MAVLQMQRISICGLKDQKKAILETLQRLEDVEVQDFVPEDGVFMKPVSANSAAEYERSIHDAENALEVLDTYDPQKSGLMSMFEGRDVVPVEKFEGFEKEYHDVSKTIEEILALSKKITEENAEITKCQQQIEMLEPWQSLDIPLNMTGTAKTGIFIGTLPNELTVDSVYEMLSDVSENIDCSIVSTSKEQTCIVVICEKEDSEKVSDALRAHAFSYPAVESSIAPSEKKAELQGEIEKLQAAIAEDEEKVKTYADKRGQIKFLADYQTINQEHYNVSQNLPQSNHAFILSGYTPEREVQRIKNALSKYDVEIETEAVGEDEDAPVVLKNNPFSAPMEGVVSAYALPAKGEIDPSFLVSLFYYVLFGFMLSDFAFGAIVFIGCLVLLIKNKNMELGTKRMLQLLLGGGLSAMFWGIMFGSYFGDFIPVVSETFFGHGITVRPLWLDMTTNPMTVLTLSLMIGLLHIFVGLGANAFQCIKRKDWIALIFDVICWYMILVGLVLKMLTMSMIMDILFGGRDPILGSTAGTAGLIIAAIGGVGVLLMDGRSSKNPVKRLLKGIYAIYGITGYLSDLLSYSRLLALGLATGVIASVANMIGTMFGSGVVRVIVYILVFFIINGINLFINGLGAYVHTNRLQYVEFFGKFFEGGGRGFEPYSVKTKYYKFKEN